MLRPLFYLCVLILTFGQFTNILKDSGLNLYLFDLMIGVFVITGLVYFSIRKELYIPMTLLLFYLFTAWGMVTLIRPAFTMGGTEFFVSAFYLLRFATYISAGLVLFNMLRAGMISYEQVFKVFLISGVLISIAGFFQMVVLPDFETLDPSLGWDPHKNRLASTFFDPNFTGGYLSVCLSIVFHQLLVSKKRDRFTVISGIVMALALFFTFSRSAWAFFAFVVLIYGSFRNRFLLIFAILLAFSAYFAVPRVQTRLAGITDPSDSAHFRLISWRNTLEIAGDNLILGTGYNTFRYAQVERGFFDAGTYGGHSGAGSDSSFLLILATTGVLGFVLFAVAYFSPAFYILLRSRGIGILLLAVLSGIFIQSQFINAVFFPQLMFLWIMLLVASLYVSDGELLG